MNPSPYRQKAGTVHPLRSIARSGDPTQLWGSMRRPGPVKLALPHIFLGGNLSKNPCLLIKATLKPKRSQWALSQMGANPVSGCAKQLLHKRTPSQPQNLGDTSTPLHCPLSTEMETPFPVSLPQCLALWHSQTASPSLIWQRNDKWCHHVSQLWILVSTSWGSAGLALYN